MAKVAQLAPKPIMAPPQEEVLKDLEEVLRDKFSLPMLFQFSAIFEGWTDIKYVEFAIEKYNDANGIDLLEIPQGLSGSEGARIGLVTPGRPGDPSRGGTPQMCRLAEEVWTYVFKLKMFLGIVFVFDHDGAGTAAQKKVIGELKYLKRHAITLDPREHAGACSRKDVVIEDLLPLDLQRRYFESAPATCTVDYVSGEVQRFQWHEASKTGLCDFVRTNATLEDLGEIVGLVKRVRHVLGLPDSV